MQNPWRGNARRNGEGRNLGGCGACLEEQRPSIRGGAIRVWPAPARGSGLCAAETRCEQRVVCRRRRTAHPGPSLKRNKKPSPPSAR